MYSKKAIKKILVNGHGMTEHEAIDLINECQDEFNERIAQGDIIGCEDICAEFFGLEPDYMEAFML